jgi:hypothetical protein
MMICALLIQFLLILQKVAGIGLLFKYYLYLCTQIATSLLCNEENDCTICPTGHDDGGQCPAEETVGW